MLSAVLIFGAAATNGRRAKKRDELAERFLPDGNSCESFDF
jgi:hypothetical protein